jgi:hypothetical protein
MQYIESYDCVKLLMERSDIYNKMKADEDT